MAAKACTRLDFLSCETRGLSGETRGLAGATRGLTGETPEGGVAVLTLDDPDKSANVLSASVLDEIEHHLNTLSDRSDVAGLIIASAKPGIFIAGADLTEFAANLDADKDEIVAVSRRGQQLFGRLASAPFVTVAAIDGMCVGGGAELAVWCDRRVAAADAKTQIGFPEVKLGLFPGWGGTARTPRLVGLSNAVELVTGGENVGAAEAFKLGVVDDLVESPAAGGNGDSSTAEDQISSPLIDAAIRTIAADRQSGDYLRDRRRWAEPIPFSETELGFLGATANAVIQQKTGGHYPAPLAALELMLEASMLDLDAACELEAERFAPLFGSPVNRALLNVFFLTDRAKKAQGNGRGESRPHAIKTAAVIGAGIMGQGIASANAKRGVSVVLSDSRPDALATGVSAVVREAAYDKTVRGPTADNAIRLSALVDGSTDPAQLSKSDVVIEAILENADAKRELFQSLGPHLGDQTILCSNTSTIPITELAEGLRAPDRFCGLHFFNPVRKMPLVEVIRGEKTSDATVAAMTAYTRRLGKTPVVVGDGPGFLVNRLLLPYMNEAALLVAEGVPIKSVERAAKAFGMPMGPLTLYDVVGLDTCVHAGGVMHRAFPDRVVPATLVEQLVKAGRLGQKNGKGFFDYPPTKPGKPPKGVPSDEVEKLIQANAHSAGNEPQAEPADLVDRLMLPMLVEATRAIEEGIVSDVRDVDLALILGIGFPPHKGGLFHWADTVGAARIIEKLKPLEPLGKRFEATGLITNAATRRTKFCA
ncbi:MAG: 3-hydroxyacyl-CoA dehydrogenase NAD-binding domain-containing protein [Planctomycetota bacterium]